MTSEKSAKSIEDTAGSWIFEKDSSVTQFTIERTGACATFSYCKEPASRCIIFVQNFLSYFGMSAKKQRNEAVLKDLECVCIYGYDKNPIDGLCHANTLQTVFIILFFTMG